MSKHPMSKSKTYRVVGVHRVFDTEPGQTFERQLSPEEEQRLVAERSIEKVGAEPAAAKASEVRASRGVPTQNIPAPRERGPEKE